MNTNMMRALSNVMIVMAGYALYKKDPSFVCVFCALGFLSETVEKLAKRCAELEKRAGK